MWSHLAYAVTHVTSAHTCHMWSYLSPVVTPIIFGHMCHTTLMKERNQSFQGWPKSEFVDYEDETRPTYRPARPQVKMRKCPPGTCSAITSNVKFGTKILHWQCFKCIILQEVNFFKEIHALHDIQISIIYDYPWFPNIQISKYPSCQNIHHLWISIMSEYHVQMSMSEYPSCPKIRNVGISMMSEYPSCPNIHYVRISNDVRVSLKMISLDKTRW